MNNLSIPPLIMAGVTFYVGAYHVPIYLRQKEQRENLTFALSCLAMGLYDLFTAGLYNTTSAAEGVNWQQAQVVTLALVAITFAWFVYDYLRSITAVSARTKTVLICLSIYFALAAVSGMLDRSGLYRPLDRPAVKEILFFGRQITYYEMDPGPLTNLQSVVGLVGFVYLLFITVRVYRSGYRKETRPLLLAMALFFASAVNDTAVVLGFYPFVYTLEYAYLGMVLLMTYSLTSAVVEAAAMKYALQNSEARTRALLHAIPDSILEMDRDGQLLSLIPSHDGETAMPRGQLVGTNLQEVMPQPIAQRVMQVIGQSLKVGEVQTIEYQLPMARGMRDYEFRIVACGENSVLAIERDITERRQAERALRESEERFRSIFKNAVMGLYRSTPDGRWIMANPALLRMLGYSSFEELARENIVTGADTVAYPRSAFIERIEQEGQVVGFEAAWPKADGGMLFIRESAKAIRDQAGNTLYYEGTVEDISEHKQVEAERERLLADLMHRETQLLTAAEVSTSASTILDPGELIGQAVELIQQRFNTYYVGLFLVDEAGEYAVLHAGTGEAGQKMLEAGHQLAVGSESMIGQCVAHAQARIARDTGEEAFHFNNPLLPETRSEMAIPLNSRGQCIGALTVQSSQEAAFSPSDITALQTMADQLAIAIANARLYDEVQRYATRLEELVAERTAALAAVNKELEAFAYSVSHDLRAPLRSMDGFSQALLEDYADQLDATGRDYLQRVRAGSQRMGQLIDDLLELSRLTRVEMQRARVDLSTMAREITAELHRTEPERQVGLIIAEGVVAQGDARLLRVVLKNLLGNAWKFTSKRMSAIIEFGCTEGERGPVYFVCDDGAGFDMAYAARLFAAFQRLHSTTEFEGIGIGLATVQRIIHRHGGRVWARGVENQGATFYFTLAAEGGEDEPL